MKALDRYAAARYLSAIALTAVGNGAYAVAASWAIVNSAHGAALVNVMFLLGLAPPVLLRSKIEAIMQKHTLWVILVVADVGQFLISSVVPIAALFIPVSAALIMCQEVMLSTGGSVTFLAARLTIRSLYPAENLRWGNQLLGATFAVGNLVGMAAGGAVVAAVGPVAAMAINTASFICSLCFVVTLAKPLRVAVPTGATKPSPVSDPAPGAQARDSALVRSAAVISLIFSLQRLIQANISVIVHYLLDAGAQLQGVLQGCTAAGGLASIFVFGKLRDRSARLMLRTAAPLTALFVIVASSVSVAFLSIAVFVVLGVMLQCSHFYQSHAQQNLPWRDEIVFLGNVNAAQSLASAAAFAAGAGLSLLMAPPLALAVIASFAFLIAIGLLRAGVRG